MSINDHCRPWTRFAMRPELILKKAALNPVNAFDDAGGQAKTGVEQNVSVIGKATVPPAQMRRGGDDGGQVGTLA